MSDFTVTGVDIHGKRVVDAPSSTQLSYAESVTIIGEGTVQTKITATKTEEKPQPRTVRDINGDVREIKSTRAERRNMDKMVRTHKRRESKKREAGVY